MCTPNTMTDSQKQNLSESLRQFRATVLGHNRSALEWFVHYVDQQEQEPPADLTDLRIELQRVRALADMALRSSLPDSITQPTYVHDEEYFVALTWDHSLDGIYPVATSEDHRQKL